MELNLSGRQSPLVIYERFGYLEWNASSNSIDGVIVIPSGAHVTQAVEVIIETAFVGPTGADLLVENDTTGANIATVDLTGAPGATSVLAVGFQPAGFRIRVAVIKEGDDATAGAARITGAYVIDKRATETQPGD